MKTYFTGLALVSALMISATGCENNVVDDDPNVPNAGIETETDMDAETDMDTDTGLDEGIDEEIDTATPPITPPLDTTPTDPGTDPGLDTDATGTGAPADPNATTP